VNSDARPRLCLFVAGRCGQCGRAVQPLWNIGRGELPGPADDRICGVTFECDVPAMIEKMLDARFNDPPKEIAA
jgi:hypothetical protein